MKALSIIITVLIISWLLACQKAPLSPPIVETQDVQQRPGGGFITCFSPDFIICTETVSYNGSIGYQHSSTIKKRVATMSFHFETNNFLAAANGYSYVVRGNKDTVINITTPFLRPKSFTVDVPVSLKYESHTTLDLNGMIRIRLSINAFLQVTAKADILHIPCAHPPYLFRPE